MKKKLLALFLCCALSFGLVTAALITPAAADEDFLVYGSDGLVAHTVELAKNNKLELTAVASTGSGVYQWQIQVGGDVWANISGANGVKLDVSYALVANLLYGGAANLRCRLTAGEVVKYTNTVTVQITDETPVSAPAQAPKAPTVISEAEPVGEPVIIPPQTVEETPAPDAAPAADAAPANDLTANVAPAALADPAQVNDPAPSDDGGEDEDDDRVLPATYTISVSYVFGDGVRKGQQAAPMWSATVPEGNTFIQTVHSPVILGYNADQLKVDINTVVDKDITYTVLFYAAKVDFKVNHYWQNADDDNYTLHETVTKQGLTGEMVGDHLENTYDGFIALLYEASSEVLADGSTVIDIYYDREYFLMNFDLDGGYGVEPIYARYGAAIGDIGTPKKTGYTFAGWTQDGKTKVDPAKTMPFKGTSYKAMWTIGDSAKVTVVVWGENPDDEGYSFYKNAEITAKPGEKLKLDSPTCGKVEHTHTDDCIVCQHVHGLTCYGLSANAQSTNPNNEKAGWNNSDPESYFSQLGVEDGYLYYDDENAQWSSFDEDHFYLRFNGKYYKLTNAQFNTLKGEQVGSTSDNSRKSPDYYYKYKINAAGISCTHTHTDSCYSCGMTEHTHTNDCFDIDFMDDALWKLVKADEIGEVAADGSSILNVYYDRREFTLHFRKARSNNDDYGTITAKWGSNIRSQFIAKNTLAGTSNWSEKSNAGSPWTSYMDIMPTKDMTFYANTEGYGTSTAYYYVEGLDGKDKLFYENKSTGSGYTVTKEEFIEIKGFTFNASRSSEVGDSFNGAKFYYTRNSYKLEFYNYNATIEGKTANVKYEAPLNGYGFTPDYPSGMEPNAYIFDGWYTTAGCYEGSEADLSSMTMPAANVILYAKWSPKSHTVKTFRTGADLNGNPMDTRTVQHGKFVENPPEKPTNGNYEFVGWFYKTTDADGNEVEKAFDFSMPVNRDLDLYAKWRSNTPVNYNVRYVLEGTETEIAPATTGSALAGSTKNFVAKTGDLLDEGYKEHYFPKVPVYPMTLEIDGTNEYKFEYVNIENVKYTVRYLDRTTGQPVVGTDGVTATDEERTSSKAIITEPYKRVKGYMPDAYQKQLVLSANAEDNVLIFWYVKDPNHAPVQITHWVQNANGSGYTIYQTSTDLNAQIGENYPATPLDIPGFVYNADPANPVVGNPPLASGVLTEDGLSLNLYYDRILYPYEFRFLEYGTTNPVAEPVSGTARYQDKVTQEAKTVPGYTLVEGTKNPQTITIAMEEGTAAVNNVRTFYYVAETVNISYRVVGPTGCGSLDNYQDNTVKVIDGTVIGSTPTASAGFKFVGWFKDEACTETGKVEASWIGADNKLTPGKTKNYGTEETTAMGYEAATYYAKFEYDVADLTITKHGYVATDGEQSFIFTVTGPEGFSKKIVIQGNGTVVLKGLKIGEYAVTEDTAWSWRYTPESGSVSITLKPGETNAVTYVNERTNDKWLGDDSYVKNVFTKTVSGN